MLVYANYLSLERVTSSNEIFRSIGGWLKEQLGFGLRPETLKRRGQHKGQGEYSKSWLRIYATPDGTPEFYAWVLKIPDNSVRGRQWITELGLRISGDLVDLSCVVKTDEISTLVVQQPMASQPRVIRYFLNNVSESNCGSFAPSVPGRELKVVGQSEDSYRGLLAEIEHESRDSPLIIISPRADGEYLVHPSKLQERVFGLAQVVRVSEDFHSGEMENAIGQRWSAWDGAINLIRPQNASGIIPNSLFLSEEIESWGKSQHEKLSRLLATVTANTNIPRLRKRISPEGVAQIAMRRYLQNLHHRAAETTASNYQAQLEKLTEDVKDGEAFIADLDSYSDDLKEQNENLESSLEEARNTVSQKEFEIHGLKARLKDAGQQKNGQSEIAFLVELVRKKDQPSPTQCLQVVQSLYGDRCTILNTGWQSASKMNRFVRGSKLLDLLVRLVTDYREALLQGGDSQARHCFGPKEFAATESQTILSNKDLARARTFEYGGELVQMFRHLKIGIVDDKTKTIRVHFHWDSCAQKIVIGHCGAHLPIPSQ